MKPAPIQTPDVVIEVRDIAKIFKIYDNPVTGPILDILGSAIGRRPAYRQVQVLKGVSFDIHRGETVGILGLNGSGKTTLLKIVAGLMRADEGSVTVRGRLTALLAMGVGVHPDFSGRENIFGAAMLMGFNRNEIADKVKDIIEFSELGDYIDQPFRTYSSGMKARLLFSVSMSFDPDIMVIDEALATGDIYFVEKCMERIREICQSGSTVLFVSHNITQVRELCTRAAVLKDGRMLSFGAVEEQIEAYQKVVFDHATEKAGALAKPLHAYSDHNLITINLVRVMNDKGEDCLGFHTGGFMKVQISFESSLPPETPVHIFVGMESTVQQRLAAEMDTIGYIHSDSSKTTVTSLPLPSRGTIELTMYPLVVLNGHYSFRVIIYDGKSEHYCDFRGGPTIFVARERYAVDHDVAGCWQPVRFDIISNTVSG